MIMCDDDDYLMEHFEPGNDDKLGFNSKLKNMRFLKNTYTFKNLLFL